MRFIDLAQILKVNYVHDLRCQVKNFLWFATKGTIEYVKIDASACTTVDHAIPQSYVY